MSNYETFEIDGGLKSIHSLIMRLRIILLFVALAVLGTQPAASSCDEFTHVLGKFGQVLEPVW